MTTTDTQVSNLIINTMTKEQYDSITPSATELYMVTDEVFYTAGNGIDSTALQNGTLQVSTTVASKTDIGDGKTIFKKNNTAFATISANQTSTINIDYTIPTQASDVHALPDTTTIGAANTTIQVNSTAVGTINANATTASAINITVPTNTNELTNGAGFITSSALSSYQLIAQNMTSLSASGSISLSDNTINKISATGTVTFTLPTVTDLTKFHQIFIQLYMSSAQTINIGTSYYFNKTAPDLSTAGTYNIYYEYDNTASHWVVGVLPKGQ